jgi:hypothetical protein
MKGGAFSSRKALRLARLTMSASSRAASQVLAPSIASIFG